MSWRLWRQLGGTITHCKGCLTDQPPRRNTTLAASRPALHPQVLPLELGLDLIEGIGLAAVRRGAGSVCKNHGHFGSPFMISG
jgi:hypothetical protein